MALFEKKTKGAKKEAKPRVKKASNDKALADTKLEGKLTAPWMSEKALIGTERGIYVFQVPLDATKGEIAKAVERLYKVIPTKINVVNVKGKSKALRGRRGFGMRSKRRKAYVFLAKGDSIQF